MSNPQWLDDRGDSNGLVVGRLKPGVSLKSAEAAINTIATQLGREYPKDDEGVSIVLSPPGMAGNFLRGAITGFSAVLMVVAGLVLLIACVNLASLLLARASDRRKETAIRLALGASRGQLLRQLLTESLMLSIAGGAAGILLAYWLNDLVNVWRPPVDVPVIPHVVHGYARAPVYRRGFAPHRRFCSAWRRRCNPRAPAWSGRSRTKRLRKNFAA